MANLKIWHKIPSGSRLELAVTGTGAAAAQTFVASARLLVDTGVEEQWPDAQLRPGPKIRQLVSPEVYVVRVAVLFAGTATADITARIVKPDGSVHGDPYTNTVSGNNGDIARATLLAVTLKS